MGRARQGRDGVAGALLETARALDRTWPGRKASALREAAVLALLRRSALAGLHPGLEPERAWGEAAAAGCPLLDPALDPRPEEARPACRLASPPPEAEPERLYERLQDLELARRAGALNLGRAREERRARGAFYTPAWMVARLVDLALDELAPGALPPCVLDPACGDGRLLVAAARRLGRAAVLGVDRDPLAVALARTNLWRLAAAGGGPAATVVCGDALTGPVRPGPGAAPPGAIDWTRAFPEAGDPGRQGFDVILTNPPFEVLTGFRREPRRRAYAALLRRAGYQLSLEGVLNTCRLFLERCLELLAPGGRLAIVLPFSFLMDRASTPLRAHLLRRGQLDQVVFFQESLQTFEGVGQGVLLLSAVQRSAPGHGVRVVDGASGREERLEFEHLVALDPENLPLPLEGAAGVGLAARLRSLNPGELSELAEGRVGEVDQTVHRPFMRSAPASALLVRGAHLAPYRVELGLDQPEERWLDAEGFGAARGGGWREDVTRARVVQTGIVNLEAGRRLVAAEVPAGVYLGNSVNAWVPRPREELDEEALRAYLLGLLNSAPLEWRFRLTSSNHNVNLYEVRALPLPRLGRRLPAERLEAFAAGAAALVAGSRASPLGTVHRITGGWGVPAREDRAVALLIGRVARLRQSAQEPGRAAWLDQVLDHLVNWHLGLEESDLARMLERMPARDPARDERQEPPR